LDLYRDVIMPRLTDGPKTLTVLDVPLYAMHHLERAGLVRSKREKVQLTTGTLAIQVWYRAEDFPARADSRQLCNPRLQRPGLKLLDWFLDSCGHLPLPWLVLSVLSWFPIAVVAEGLQVPGRSLIEVIWPVALITGPATHGAMLGFWWAHVTKKHRA
jgi:hypothetical protein